MGASHGSLSSKSKSAAELRGPPGNRTKTEDMNFFGAHTSIRGSTPSSLHSVPGPGHYEDQVLPYRVRAPLHNEFPATGKPRTRCTVSALSTAPRFIDRCLMNTR